MTDIPESEIVKSYEGMRRLNPDLPLWEDASPHIKSKHRRLHEELIDPTFKKLVEIYSSEKNSGK